MSGSIDNLTSRFINDKVVDSNSAIEGASYIIAEYISDNAYYRKWIRSFTYRNGIIVCKAKKDHTDTKKVYEMYYDYSEAVKDIKPHRVLAINRAEALKVISVSISINVDDIIKFLGGKL